LHQCVEQQRQAQGGNRQSSFLIGKLGQFATQRLPGLIAPLGLRPRHCGVLELLRAGNPAQLTIASTMGVSDGVVVNILDELADLEASEAAALRAALRVLAGRHGLFGGGT